MRHYLDHASTSPLRPEGKLAAVEALDLLGDPSRIHTEGMEARYAVETAREKIANFVGARPREVVFTSGASESIASAILGAMAINPKGHIVTSQIEHSSVLENVEQFSHTKIGVDDSGQISLEELASSLNEKTVLVSLQHINHEIGSTQDIASVVAEAKKHDVLTHIDAAQSVGRIPFDFMELDADLVSISAHKFGGPLGIGALLIKQGLRIQPLLKGGSQERARRGGMENLTAIVGFGAVAESLTQERLVREAQEASDLTQHLIATCEKMEGIVVYCNTKHRAPHIACLGFERIEPQAILLELDRRGISVHSGSACASEELEGSSVLMALGVDAERSLRVSVGWNTTKADIQAFIVGLEEALDYLGKLNF